MRSALVIGASGLLGQHLFERLREVTQVVGLSRRTGLDLTSARSVSELPAGFDVVFNCAVALEGQALDELVAVNALGAQRVAQYALQIGAHLVHASTIFALGSPGDTYYGPYGMTKRLGDDLVNYTASRAGQAAAVLRFSQLYDAAGRSKRAQPMLFRLIDQIREDGCAILYGSHDPLRNYIHVDDAVAIMLRAAEQRLTGSWPATHPDSVTVTELATKIGAQLGKRAEIRWLADKPALPDMYIPDAEALYRQLDWSPQVGLDAGLARLIHGR